MNAEEARRVIDLLETASNIGLTLTEQENKILKEAKDILEKENKKNKNKN